MPLCHWCLKTAIFHDHKLHYACREHKEQLLPGLRETAREYDRLAAGHEAHRRQRDDLDLSR